MKFVLTYIDSPFITFQLRIWSKIFMPIVLYVFSFIKDSFASFKQSHEIKITFVLFVILALNKRLFIEKQYL